MEAVLTTLLSLCVSVAVYAHDFGTFGNTFEIQEENILEYLKDRLLKVKQELFSKEEIQAFTVPKQVNLSNAKRYRCFFYDPSITVHADIKDIDGNVIIKKGTKYNPLDDHKLSEDLLFFDETQESHLAWARTHKGKWILVKGKPIELEEQQQHPVYFDQGGYLTSKLGIKAVPAKVSQECKRLKVEEFSICVDHGAKNI